jgi:hypothetical protein
VRYDLSDEYIQRQVTGYCGIGIRRQAKAVEVIILRLPFVCDQTEQLGHL